VRTGDSPASAVVGGPPDFVDLNMPHVTHERWNSIPPSEHIQLIERVLSEYLCAR
jgi:hypothetical protein